MKRRIEKMQRAFEFARHMPPGKIIRRIDLSARRWLSDRAPVLASSRSSATPLPRAMARPSALFPPRTELAPRVAGDQLHFKFLNRTIAMPARQVNWTAPSLHPADQLWRMNLHYMEYLEGVDDECFVRLIDDWLTAYPVAQRGAWRDSWNSYALSLRVVVWLQELARRTELDDALVRRAEVSVTMQLRYLERNLETDLGGNHLIKNIKALLWASAYFSGEDAVRWRRLGLALLKRELATQVLPDGIHYERSPSYQAQVFADLLECRHALAGDPTQGALDGALKAMAQGVADLAHPDGGPALFNDAGLSMAYSPEKCLAAFAAVYGDSPRRRHVFAFRDGGYFGLHTDASTFIADCGRIAPDDLPAHGHGDVLSFEWSVAGNRIIVDQGVYEYFAGARRDASRACAFHNTLNIADVDQADFFGAFRCGRRPNVTIHQFTHDADGFVLEGSHDGFKQLAAEPVHVRKFEVRPRKITIVDMLEGAASGAATINILLHPDVAPTQHGDHWRLQCGGVRIRVTASRSITVRPAVWWPDMGCEQNTHRLSVELKQGERRAELQLKIE
jgi:uncharacterized heparinase superfamily protein